MRTFLAFALLLFCSGAYAFGTHLEVDGLTEAQKAELTIQASKMVEDTHKPGNISKSVRDETSAWVDLGKNVGVAMVASAKEVGMAANDFAQTPLGKVTTAIVVWKLIGKSIVAFFVGTALIIIGCVVAWNIFRRFSTLKIEYDNISRLGGLWVSRKVKSVTSNDDRQGEAWFGSVIPLVIFCVVALIVMFV